MGTAGAVPQPVTSGGFPRRDAGAHPWESPRGRQSSAAAPARSLSVGTAPVPRASRGCSLPWEEASGARWWPQSSGTPGRRLPRGEAVPAGTFQAAATYGFSSFPKKPWRGFGFSSEGRSIFNALSHHPHFLRLSTPATNDPLGAGSTAGTLLEVPLVATGSKSRGRYLGFRQGELPRW